MTLKKDSGVELGIIYSAFLSTNPIPAALQCYSKKGLLFERRTPSEAYGIIILRNGSSYTPFNPCIPSLALNKLSCNISK